MRLDQCDPATMVAGGGPPQKYGWMVVLDGRYNVPAGYAGRVLMGMGPGPYLGTHAKPVTHEYP